MRALAIAVVAVCAACSTEYETFEVSAASTASASSTGTGGSGGTGGAGGAGGAAGHGGIAGAGGGGGGGAGGAPTGVHCGNPRMQCKASEVCCHKADAGDPNADYCHEGLCPMEFGAISCDDQSDCNNPTTICCATFLAEELVDISCKPGCGFAGQAVVCSGGTPCPTGTCTADSKLPPFYSLCE